MSETNPESTGGAPRPPRGPFAVGGWTVDPASGRLTSGQRQVQIEPKVMQVLEHLARRAGEVVTREELEARVWAGTIVGYDAVANTVIKLRKAFGDDARRPCIIETLSKRGYRLVAPVDWAPAGKTGAPPAASGAPAQVPTPRHRQWRLAVAVAAAAIVLLWWIAFGTRDPPAPPGAGTNAPPEPARVAVLPFENLGNDPAQDYFSSGITADLITDLSKIAGLRVIAQSSSAVYGPGTTAPETVARELDVRYLLRGHVQREGMRVRINVQLLDVREGGFVWAERYDRDLSDLFGLQDEIREKIVASLAVSLPAGARGGPARKYAASIEAYDLLLRGLDHLGRRDPEDIEAAAGYFREAMVLDPGFARPYASLGVALARDAMDGWSRDALASLTEAGRLADQAQALDDSLPQVHFVQALVRLFRRDHAGAVQAAERAVSLQPSYADAYAVLAWTLHFAGRSSEALELLRQAVRLNPRLPAAYLLTEGEIHMTQGKHDRAIAVLEQAGAQSPTHPRVLLMLAAAYQQAGRAGEADWTVKQLQLLHSGISLANLRWALPFLDTDEAEKILRALRAAGVPE